MQRDKREGYFGGEGSESGENRERGGFGDAGFGIGPGRRVDEVSSVASSLLSFTTRAFISMSSPELYLPHPQIRCCSSLTRRLLLLPSLAPDGSPALPVNASLSPTQPLSCNFGSTSQLLLNPQARPQADNKTLVVKVSSFNSLSLSSTLLPKLMRSFLLQGLPRSTTYLELEKLLSSFGIMTAFVFSFFRTRKSLLTRRPLV